MPEKINQKPAWLVSWNVKAWNWDDYEKACANTKQGKSYTKAWACFSTKPQVGDEVFLIKLGSGKRGIIGHGYVIKESHMRTSTLMMNLLKLDIPLSLLILSLTG